MTVAVSRRMKDSGDGSLGKVPAHWDLQRLKWLVQMRSGENITSDAIDDTGTFPVFGGNGLRGYTDDYTHEGRHVAIGRQGAHCGNVQYADGRFWASEHAVVVSPLKDCHVTWLGELLRAMNLNQYSVAAAQPGLAVERILNLLVPVPPLDEQRAIAEFLDRKTAAIDGIIRKKERLIELLEEKQQAVITRAVTKGLDPSVPMKDSGVEWIGEVPAHWRAVRLKFLAREPLTYGANEAADIDDPGLPRYIRITDVNADGTLRADTFRSLPENVAEPYLLEAGDILFARSGATVGKAFAYRTEWGRACFAGYMIRFRPNPVWVMPEFASYYTQSLPYAREVQLGAIQATIQNVSAERYGNFVVPLPPRTEQETIVGWLNTTTVLLGRLTEKLRGQIAVLREYRQTLISNAVTGKIDVREPVAV